MNSSTLSFKVTVVGTGPKEYKLCVTCPKGELSFDYEMYQLVLPTNFKKHCEEVGATWAYRYEKEILESLHNFLNQK